MLHVSPSHAAADAVPALPTPVEACAAARARVEGRMAMLARLAAIGMRIAEAAGARATAALAADAPPPEGGDRRDPALVFTRAARAVRMTVALQGRLEQDLAALLRDEGRERLSQTQARRIRVQRLVERALEAGSDDIYEIHQLSGEVRERLRDEDDFGALLDRPFEQIVAHICAELGIAVDADLFAPADPLSTALPGDGGDAGSGDTATLDNRAWVPASARTGGLGEGRAAPPLGGLGGGP